MRVLLDVITMSGTKFVLVHDDADAPAFPAGEVGPGERPQDVVRRLVETHTGTTDPKLELVDLRVDGDDLSLVFRALLTAEPSVAHTLVDRPSLPEHVGRLTGADVVDALKTSLNYKLTRR